MSQVTYAPNDDGKETTAGVVTLTDTTVVFGAGAGQGDFIAFRFVSVAIPQGSTIRHAYLLLNLTGLKTTSASINAHGEAADNSAALAVALNNISGRTQTTASMTQGVDDLNDGNYFLDVTSLVQEIINRGGWASGNALTIIFGAAPVTSVGTVSMSESANPPSLSIIYGDSATSVLSPTVSGTGTYTNPDNGFHSDDVYATTVDSTNAAQIWGTYGIPSLTGATNITVLVQAEGKVASSSQRAQYTMELSWDGGTTWTTAKTSFKLTTSDAFQSYGGADAWSHTFVPGDLTDSNFKVRLTNDFASATEDSSVDWVSCQVFYTAAAGGGAHYLSILGAGT